MDKRDYQTIQSVQRACLLLEAIGREGEAGVREMAKSIGLGKSTVQRLASTLEQMGYLRQSSETAKYSLSLKLLELGTRALERYGLRELAMPTVQELAKQTNEAVHMAVLDRGEAVFIDCQGPSHFLQVFTRPGQRVPCHCTAVGKALLAYQRDEPWGIVQSAKLRRFSERTVVDKESLLRELEGVRARGYATNDEEHENGLRAAAAPIWDHTGSAVAAIGIAGPSLRIQREDLIALGELVQKAAAEISERLGYTARVGILSG